MRWVILTCLALTVFLACSEDSGINHRWPPGPDSLAPWVQMSSPEEGSVLSGLTRVEALAGDETELTRVLFLLDASVLGADSLPPFELEWHAGYWGDGGEHVLWAQAEDHDGNIGSSDSILVTIPFDSTLLITPLAPAESEHLPAGGILELHWSTPEQAQAVATEIEIASDPEFTRTLVKLVVQDAPWTPPELSTGWRHWRARPINALGHWGPWSRAARFHWGSVFDRGHVIPGLEGVTCTLLAPEGDLLVGGKRDGFVWLARFDEGGEMSWDRVFDIADLTPLSPICIKLSTEGGYAMAGQTSSGYIFVLKLDESGHEQWRREYGSIVYPGYPSSLQPMSQGGYLLAGRGIEPEDSMVFVSWFRRLDANGESVWTDHFFDVNLSIIIAELPGGGILTHGGNNAYGISVDEAVEIFWSRSIAGFQSVIIDGARSEAGGLAFLCYTYEHWPHDTHYLVFLDEQGSNFRRLDLNLDGAAYSGALQALRAGDLLLSVKIPIEDGESSLLTRIDEFGESSWSNEMGEPSGWGSPGMEETECGDILFVDYRNSSEDGIDLRLVRMDSEGWFETP